MPTYRMDRPGKVYRRMTPDTDYGDSDDRAELICDTWIRLFPLKVDEKRHAEQMYGHATHRMIIRRPTREVGPRDWIESLGKRYEILGVSELGGDFDYLDFVVTEERTADGGAII